MRVRKDKNDGDDDAAGTTKDATAPPATKANKAAGTRARKTPATKADNKKAGPAAPKDPPKATKPKPTPATATKTRKKRVTSKPIIEDSDEGEDITGGGIIRAAYARGTMHLFGVSPLDS